MWRHCNVACVTALFRGEQHACWGRVLSAAKILTNTWLRTLGVRFMGPTWDSSWADRTQVGPMLAPWILLSGYPHVPMFWWVYSQGGIIFFNINNISNTCSVQNDLCDMIAIRDNAVRRLLFPVWFQMYILIVYFSILYHNMDIGTMQHCALVSCTHQSIELPLGVRCSSVKCH